MLITLIKTTLLIPKTRSAGLLRSKWYRRMENLPLMTSFYGKRILRILSHQTCSSSVMDRFGWGKRSNAGSGDKNGMPMSCNLRIPCLPSSAIQSIQEPIKTSSSCAVFSFRDGCTGGLAKIMQKRDKTSETNNIQNTGI
jgi:hypothetical protein